MRRIENLLNKAALSHGYAQLPHLTPHSLFIEVSEGAASHAAYDFASKLTEKKRVADTRLAMVKKLVQ